MKFGVVALLLSATIVIGIAAFESHALFPAPSHAKAEGIVWQGRTFVTRREFARWLRARGVSYAAWARQHPSLAGIPAGHRGARAERAGHKNSVWSARSVGGGLVLLGGIGLLFVFVRRRWPDRLESAIDAVRFGLESAMDAVWLATRRAGPPAKEGARTILRWVTLAALLTARKAESWARIIQSRGPELARSVARRVGPVAKRGARLILALATTLAVSTWRLSASAAKGGAGLMLGLATAVALLFSSVPTSPAKRGTPTSGAKRGTPASRAKRRTRSPLLSSKLGASAADAIRRRRGELTWYLATAVVATGVGVLATVWLNRA
jgi:hypothetical protein